LGIIPRAIRHLFRLAAERGAQSTVTVRAAFLEIVNEEARAPRHAAPRPHLHPRSVAAFILAAAPPRALRRPSARRSRARARAALRRRFEICCTRTRRAKR
jgi:hypothetical protein